MKVLKQSKRCKNISGFSLVELSVVIIIIGLIISSVIVGKSVVRSAGLQKV